MVSQLRRALTNILACPGRYIQGRNALNELGQHVKVLGKKAFVIGGPTALSIVEKPILENLTESGVAIAGIDRTVKECTHQTIQRLSETGNTPFSRHT